MKQYQKKQALETAIGGVFLLLGLVSVGCVLLICTYLVISGIPAIRKIGLVPFLFGMPMTDKEADHKTSHKDSLRPAIPRY